MSCDYLSKCVSTSVVFLLAVLFVQDLAGAKTFDLNDCKAAGGDISTSCPADRVLGDVTGVHCLCSCCKIVVPLDCASLSIHVSDVCSTGRDLRGVLTHDGSALNATDLYFELEGKKSRFMANTALPKSTGPASGLKFKAVFPKWAKGPATKSSGYRLTFGTSNQSCRLPGFEIPPCR